MYTENKNATYECGTHVTDTFLVKKYDNIIINAEYLIGNNNSGVLDQCLEITENGIVNRFENFVQKWTAFNLNQILTFKWDELKRQGHDFSQTLFFCFYNL